MQCTRAHFCGDPDEPCVGKTFVILILAHVSAPTTDSECVHCTRAQGPRRNVLMQPVIRCSAGRINCRSIWTVLRAVRAVGSAGAEAGCCDVHQFPQSVQLDGGVLDVGWQQRVPRRQSRGDGESAQGGSHRSNPRPGGRHCRARCPGHRQTGGFVRQAVHGAERRRLPLALLSTRPCVRAEIDLGDFLLCCGAAILLPENLENWTGHGILRRSRAEKSGVKSWDLSCGEKICIQPEIVCVIISPTSGRNTFTSSVCVKLKNFRWFLYFGIENLPRKVAEFVLSGKWEVGSGNSAYYGPIFRLSRSIKHLHISFDFYFIFTLSLFFTCCYIYALFLIVCCMCENVAWELKKLLAAFCVCWFILLRSTQFPLHCVCVSSSNVKCRCLPQIERLKSPILTCAWVCINHNSIGSALAHMMLQRARSWGNFVVGHRLKCNSRKVSLQIWAVYSAST